MKTPPTLWRACLFGGGLLALVALAAGGYLGWDSYQASRAREEGLRLWEGKRFSAAEPFLRRAAEHYPDDADVAQALALGLSRSSRGRDALPHAARWADLQPDNSAAQRLLMTLLLEQGRRADAIEAGRRALELQPADLELRLLVVRVQLDEGRFADAEQTCRRGVTLNPAHAQLRARLADACSRQGKAEEARAILDDLIAREPRFPIPLVLRAALHREAGEEKQAIPLLRKAIAMDRSLKPAHYHLAQALARTGEAAESERVMAEFLRLGDIERVLLDVQIQPENVELKVKAAELLLGSQRVEEAARLLREAVTKDPSHDGARRLLASLPRGK